MRLAPGITLEETPRGWFHMRFYDPKRPQTRKRVALRTQNPNRAYKLATELQREYELGIYDPWKDRRDTPTAKQAAKEFEKAKARTLRPRSLEVLMSIVNRFVESLPVNCRIDQVETNDIETFVYHKRLAPTTRETYYRNLHVFFAWCVGAGMLRAIPPAKRPRKVQTVPKYLTVEQLDELLEVIAFDCQLKGIANWLGDVVEFAATTGLRRGELIHLRWADLILGERSYIVVQGHEGYRTKHDSAGVVPLIPRAKALVTRLLDARVSEDPEELVLKDAGGKKIRGDYLSKRFLDYRRKAKLPDVPFHGLRHTFAVMCRLAGVELMTLQDLMRHKDIKMTMNYARFSPELLHDRVNEAFKKT